MEEKELIKAVIIGYLAIVNILSFLLMAFDKYKARNGLWRIKESTLFLVAFSGGSLGAYIGMYAFKHKVRKSKFFYGFPTLLVIQSAIVAFVFLKFLK